MFDLNFIYLKCDKKKKKKKNALFLLLLKFIILNIFLLFIIGIAFVDFASSEQAAKAFEFAQGVELMGRRLKVDYSDKPNPNRSFQSDGGSRDSGSRDSGSRDNGP